MAGSAVTLREIHRLRRHARDLQDQIERAPRALQAQKNKVTRQEENLREAQEQLKKLKVTIHDKEITLRTKVQQIDKHEKQMNEATAKKEYDALKVEVSHDKQLVAKLEDEILSGIGESEERAAKLPELEKAVQQAREEYAQFEKGQQSRQADLAEQLRKVNEEIRQVEASLPADVMQQYQRLLAARGEDAMSAVNGRTCVACYTEITAQSYNELLTGQFVACKNCGRILYLPE